MGKETLVIRAFSSSVAGVVPASGGADTDFLCADGLWKAIILDAAHISGLAPVAISGAYADLTGAPGLAPVATSGAYSDLTGKPTLGTSAAKDIPATGNATSGQVVLGSDTRLSDARTPTAHAASHAAAGSDPVAIAASQVSGLAAVATSGSATDLGTGTLPAARLPNPAATTLGGVKSLAAVSHNFLTSISTAGLPVAAQPAAGDITGLAASATTDTTNASNITSGTLPAAQLPNPSATTLGGVKSLAAASHNFLTSISTAGLPVAAQPAFTDISGSVAAGQMPALTGDVTTTAGAVATTIGANKVANSQLAQMAANTFKGNNTGSTANALDLTVTQATAALNALVGDSGSGGTKGLAPAPGAGDAAAGKFLKADATWGVPAGGSSSPSLPGAQGLKVTNNVTTPNSKIDVTAAAAVLTTSSGAPFLAAAPSVTIDLTTTGANALDTGTIAASTWYHVYLIYNGSTVAGLASLSATAPTLPSGYTFSMRVGAMQTDASNNLYRTIQLGSRSRYKITATTNTSTYPKTFTGSTSSAWASKQVTGNSFGAPTTAVSVLFTALFSSSGSNNMGVAPNTSFTSPASGTPVNPVFGCAGVTVNNAYAEQYDILLESNSVAYFNSSTVSYVEITGWQDAVNAC